MIRKNSRKAGIVHSEIGEGLVKLLQPGRTTLSYYTSPAAYGGCGSHNGRLRQSTTTLTLRAYESKL